MFSQFSYASSSSSTEKINATEHYLNKQKSTFGKSATTSIQHSLASITSVNALKCNATTSSSLVYAASGISHVASDIARSKQLQNKMEREYEILNGVKSRDNVNQKSSLSLLSSYDKLVKNIEQQKKMVAASMVANKVAAATSYAEATPRIAANANLAAETNACVAGGSTPQFAAQCQGCIQKALNALNIVQNRSVGANDGLRSPAGFDNSKDVKIEPKAKDGEDQTSVKSTPNPDSSFESSIHSYLNLELIMPFLGMVIKSAHANFNCDPSCLPCQNIDRSISQYFVQSIKSLDNCPEKMASPTDFLSGILVKQLGVGNTLGPIALSLAPPTSSFVNSFLQKPLDRGLMMEATSELARKNFVSISQNLELVKLNREKVRALVARMQNEKGVNLVDSQNFKYETGADKKKKYKKRTSSETAKAAADSDRKKTAKQEEEIKNSLRFKFKIPCAGGKNSTNDCLSPNLADKVFESDANQTGILDALSEPLELISRINVASSNGQLDEASRLAKILTNKENTEKVDSVLSAVKTFVNQELEQAGKELVDFESGKNQFLAGLNLLYQKRFSEKGGSFGQAITALKEFQNNGGSFSQRKIPALKQSNLKDGRNLEKLIIGEDSNQLIEEKKHPEKNKMASSKEFLSERVINYGDVNQRSDDSIFDLISHRYHKSARRYLIPSRSRASSEVYRKSNK